jgi:hypothetical protein
MFPANAHVIRRATEDDDAVLTSLAVLDSRRPIARPALIGEIDGRPAAALSLTDNRAVADPFAPTAALVTQLRMRAGALRAVQRTPSLRARLVAGVRVAPVTA